MVLGGQAVKKTWFARLTAAVTCGAVLIWALSMSSTLAFAHASVAPASNTNDPLVIVARDITAASHCQSFHGIKLTRTSSVTSVVYTPCPAGSIVYTFEVPRSQAVARHEAFVQLPSANATPQQREQAGQQIVALLSEIQPATIEQAPVQPDSCSSFENVVGNNYTLSGATVHTTVDYQKHTDCTVTFYDTTAKITSGTANDTLWKADYNSTYNFPAACKTFSSTTLADDTNLSGSFNPGYYFHQIDNTGVNCGVGTTGSSAMYIS